MGFCRRCGEIVSGDRCQCGGQAVAPIAFRGEQPTRVQDRWLKTYASEDAKPNPMPSSHRPEPSKISPTKRFPRPISTPSPSTLVGSGLGNRVSEHITSSFLPQPRRPLSPLKQTVAPESGILPSPSPYNSSLTKVYGSVLQPKESLRTHSCAICSTTFLPDSTIFPDVSTSSPDPNRFLCRTCFTLNGGSKGTCPTCSRPVLALKSEGEFVTADSRVWHRACFNCAGCAKNVGHCPMVDLLGQPSCADCFEHCLKPSHTPKKKKSPPSPSSHNIGGMATRNGQIKSRESSPALDELEARLGIPKSREGSPFPSGWGSHPSSPSPSPRRRAAETRWKHASSPSSPVTPELSSSDSTNQSISSGPDSPPRSDLDPDVKFETTEDIFFPGRVTSIVEETASELGSPRTPKSRARTRSPESSPSPRRMMCQKCDKPILELERGGDFICLPNQDRPNSMVNFHTQCFRCTVCHQLFQRLNGKAHFMKGSDGPMHLECGPPARIAVKSTTSPQPLRVVTKGNSSPSSSSRYQKPIEKSSASISVAALKFPKIGGCPGCGKSVAQWSGVVPGPHGTRWHTTCLVCGGKKEGMPTRDKRPGCGKRLDSGAKTDANGVWCRECFLLLPRESPQPSPSPTRGVFSPTSPIMGTTLARQFTGEGLRRQLTGGTLGPTRSLSPTKELKARPKSVVGSRSDRGMFLVRQMTGQSG